jgi:hypothetical protein
MMGDDLRFWGYRICFAYTMGDNISSWGYVSGEQWGTLVGGQWGNVGGLLFNPLKTPYGYPYAYALN